ncbi:DUF6491 family protein [Allosphingosinicella indica]|uniref:Uncharacterized protein n=1 Tax=Allosphingosinicella indica TaxID=941907 RepID=A0A1X7GSD9_9SPHN|nr:DUF6491 family protein [Allosphingosinicella indica]SMF73872.1 hypothetical protein SAMN06295910_2183 [Allosphingosinicella indica]
MIRLALPVAAALVCIAAAPAPKEPPPSAAKQCFFANSVNGFTNAGKNRIHVHTGPRDVYLFEVAACPNINFSQRLALQPIGGGSICSGIDVTLIVPNIAGAQKCPVRMIRKLTPEEVSAMRSRRR